MSFRHCCKDLPFPIMITGEEISLMIRKLSIIIVYGVLAAILFLAVRADLHASQTPQVPSTSEEQSAAVQEDEIQDAWIGQDERQSHALILMNGYRAVMISFDPMETDVSVRYSMYQEAQKTDSSGSFWRLFATQANASCIASVKTSREGILLMSLPDGSMVPAKAMSSGNAANLIARAQEIQNGFNQGGQHENQ